MENLFKNAWNIDENCFNFWVELIKLFKKDQKYVSDVITIEYDILMTLTIIILIIGFA